MPKYYCFKCSQEGPPIETSFNKPLGLCVCHEGWYVGTIPQLCDLLNESYQLLEDLGERNILEDYSYSEDYEDER